MKNDLFTSNGKLNRIGLSEVVRNLFEGYSEDSENVRKILENVDRKLGTGSGRIPVVRDFVDMKERTATILTSNLTGFMVNAHPELALNANEIIWRKAGVESVEGILTNYRIADETVVPVAAFTSTEGGTPNSTDPEYDDYIQVTPHSIGAASLISHRVAVTTPPAVVEYFLRRLMYARDRLIDSKMLYGTGASGEPEGAYYNDDVTVLAGDSLDKTKLDEIERLIAAAEAPFDGKLYLVHPTEEKKLKSRVISGTNKFLIEDGKLNGQSYISTPRVTAGHVWYGHFSSILLSFFGEAEIHTKKLSRTADVIFSLYDEIDISIRRPDWLAVYENVT